MMTDRDLDDLFDKRTDAQKAKHRNFIIYVGGNENHRAERRFRANCKYNPWDSKITFPTSMSHYKKTTMCKYRDDPLWHVLEDRVPPTEWDY
eukprot:7927304-Karenia_brevis.AAC.1